VTNPNNQTHTVADTMFSEISTDHESLNACMNVSWQITCTTYVLIIYLYLYRWCGRAVARSAAATNSVQHWRVPRWRMPTTSSVTMDRR